ncbi:hypothetical protein N9F63_00085 [bacterium]|nr:hypothetical protein [bacterium]
MAVNLPKSMEFVEYKPSMVGIPTQSVGRYYDRLDRDALRTEAASNAVQETLAKEIAAAAEGDKPYLNDLWGKVDGIMEQASSEKNLPGYAKQIRKLVGDISGSPEYANVKLNSQLIKSYTDNYTNLATLYGEENIVSSGDNPRNFSSSNAEGGMQKFQGFATKRPDYLKGMDDVYMKNVDIVQSVGAMEEFVDSGMALSDYLQTPEGRVHINEISQQLTGVSYDRLPAAQNEAGEYVVGEEGVAVMNRMNDLLKDAGVRYVKTAKTKASAANPRFKDLQNKGIISSGINNTTLTDGTGAKDQTISVFNDQASGSELDTQLLDLVKSDRTIPLMSGISTSDGVDRTDVIQTNQIKSSSFTSGVGPSGRPLIQVEYNMGQGEEAGIGYYELGNEDLGFVQQMASDGGFLMQAASGYTTEANRKAVMPALVNLYDPEFNSWSKGDSDADHVFSPPEGEAITIKKVSNGFALYNSDGTAIVDDKNVPAIVADQNSLRNMLGIRILKQY